MAGPSQHLHIDKSEEFGITEKLYCDTDSEKSLVEATFHQKTARRVTVMNWNGEKKFLLTNHLHSSWWGNKVD
jgi:hypothetical protein